MPDAEDDGSRTGSDGTAGNGSDAKTTERGYTNADRPLDVNKLGTLWIRWTDGEDNLQLHRCGEFIPQLTLVLPFISDEWGEKPMVSIAEEKGEKPLFEPHTRTDDGWDIGEKEQFRFVCGLPRQFLRHTPLVIGIATLLLFVGAEFTPGVRGLSDLVPVVTGSNALLFGLYLSITPILIWLLSLVDVVQHRDIVQAAVIYGVVAALGSGVAVSVFMVMRADHPSTVEPNVIFVSGYLLTLLVGGLLLYDAVLRIEHLFVKLADREKDIVKNSAAYKAFLTDLTEKLEHETILGIHPSRLFGVLFAIQFALIWTIGDGPQNLNYGLGLAVNFVLNAVLVTIVFKFLIIVRYFNMLMNVTPEYSDIELTYEPFHVDGHGGFRDFGLFATRINIILTVAGLYLIYRLYVVGGLKIPQEGVLAIEDPILLTVWLVSFGGPILAYVLGAGAWGYFSFWTLHRKMVRDKFAITRKYQRSGDLGGGAAPSAGDSIDHFDPNNGPDWEMLKEAPTWPVDVNKMVSLASGNLAPLLLPIPGLLF